VSKKPEFDPLRYIENAFLDRSNEEDRDPDLPKMSKYLAGKVKRKVKVRKTEMSAPRPRMTVAEPKSDSLDPKVKAAWEQLPRTVAFLNSMFDDKVTSNYYRGDFKETREELIVRLLNPVLSLEETSRLLGVCPATVRRYTNRGWLPHERTKGGQRRFRLSDVMLFVEKHGRFPLE
jgi:excisionase family DNA binding protein